MSRFVEKWDKHGIHWWDTKRDKKMPGTLGSFVFEAFRFFNEIEKRMTSLYYTPPGGLPKGNRTGSSPGR